MSAAAVKPWVALERLLSDATSDFRYCCGRVGHVMLLCTRMSRADWQQLIDEKKPYKMPYKLAVLCTKAASDNPPQTCRLACHVLATFLYSAADASVLTGGGQQRDSRSSGSSSPGSLTKLGEQAVKQLTESGLLLQLPAMLTKARAEVEAVSTAISTQVAAAAAARAAAGDTAGNTGSATKFKHASWLGESVEDLDSATIDSAALQYAYGMLDVFSAMHVSFPARKPRGLEASLLPAGELAVAAYQYLGAALDRQPGSSVRIGPQGLDSLQEQCFFAAKMLLAAAESVQRSQVVRSALGQPLEGAALGVQFVVDPDVAAEISRSPCYMQCMEMLLSAGCLSCILMQNSVLSSSSSSSSSRDRNRTSGSSSSSSHARDSNRITDLGGLEASYDIAAASNLQQRLSRLHKRTLQQLGFSSRLVTLAAAFTQSLLDPRRVMGLTLTYWCALSTTACSIAGLAEGAQTGRASSLQPSGYTAGNLQQVSETVNSLHAPQAGMHLCMPALLLCWSANMPATHKEFAAMCQQAAAASCDALQFWRFMQQHMAETSKHAEPLAADTAADLVWETLPMLLPMLQKLLQQLQQGLAVSGSSSAASSNSRTSSSRADRTSSAAGGSSSSRTDRTSRAAGGSSRSGNSRASSSRTDGTSSAAGGSSRSGSNVDLASDFEIAGAIVLSIRFAQDLMMVCRQALSTTPTAGLGPGPVSWGSLWALVEEQPSVQQWQRWLGKGMQLPDPDAPAVPGLLQAVEEFMRVQARHRELAPYLKLFIDPAATREHTPFPSSYFDSGSYGAVDTEFLAEAAVLTGSSDSDLKQFCALLCSVLKLGSVAVQANTGRKGTCAMAVAQGALQLLAMREVMNSSSQAPDQVLRLGQPSTATVGGGQLQLGDLMDVFTPEHAFSTKDSSSSSDGGSSDIPSRGHNLAQVVPIWVILGRVLIQTGHLMRAWLPAAELVELTVRESMQDLLNRDFKFQQILGFVAAIVEVSSSSWLIDATAAPQSAAATTAFVAAVGCGPSGFPKLAAARNTVVNALLQLEAEDVGDELVVASLTQLAGQLEMFGYELSRLPYAYGCNSPLCSCVQGTSDLGATTVCSACLKVCYCSTECQKAHWQLHRPVCRAIKAQAQG